MTIERPPSTPDRLNFRVESRMDSLALVILLYNDSGIKIEDDVAACLDELGHSLLHRLKTAKGMTSDQLVKHITAFTAEMERQRQANVPRT